MKTLKDLEISKQILSDLLSGETYTDKEKIFMRRHATLQRGALLRYFEDKWGLVVGARTVYNVISKSEAEG